MKIERPEEDVVERGSMRAEQSGGETFRGARGAKPQGAAEVVVEDPDERATRLRALRDQIDSGQYRIPAEAVADKVIRHMRRAGVAEKETSKTVSRKVAGPAAASVSGENDLPSRRLQSATPGDASH